MATGPNETEIDQYIDSLEIDRIKELATRAKELAIKLDAAEAKINDLTEELKTTTEQMEMYKYDANYSR